MSQTCQGSLVETFVNTVLSFLIGVAGNMIVLPWFGMHPNLRQSCGIGLVFTVISMVKSYAVRRWFNKHIW
jgi:hypothetical protein